MNLYIQKTIRSQKWAMPYRRVAAMWGVNTNNGTESLNNVVSIT